MTRRTPIDRCRGFALMLAVFMIVTLAAIWFARRPASAARTYGFYRTEMLAALFNSILPFGIAAFILYEAWQRLQAPYAELKENERGSSGGTFTLQFTQAMRSE